MTGGKSGYKMLVGSRSQVMNGTAYKTSYGAVKGTAPGAYALIKKHLKYNKQGRIVSVAKSAKKGALLAQLAKAGYTTRKGHFGPVKIDSKTRKKSRTRKKRKGQRCRHKSGSKKGKYKKC